MEHYHIKKIDLSSVEDVVPLFDNYRVFYRKSSDPQGAERFLKDRLRHEESIIFAVYHGNETVGFTQLYPLFSSTRMRKTWLLNDLYIQASYRGKGLSKMLIRQAKELAKETKAAGVSLETEMSNTIGNLLYPSVGFEKDTEHNFYFWENT